MMTIRTIFLPTLALALLSIACAKEPVAGVYPSEGENLSGTPLTMEVNLPGPLEDADDSTGTKATYDIVGTAGKITWEEGDEICVYNNAGDGTEAGGGAVPHKLALVGGAGTSKGIFYCESFSGTPKVAVYPYDWALDYNKTKANRVRYKIPESIDLGAGDKEPIVMLAYITDGKTIDFKHTSAYFRFTVNDIPSTVTSMTFSADAVSSGYGVTGKFYMTDSNIGSSSPKVSGTAGSSFTVKFPKGTKSGVFLVPVATGQRSACRIWFNDDSGKVLGSEKSLNKGDAYTSSNHVKGQVHNLKAFSLQGWIDEYYSDKLCIKYTNIWEDLTVDETSQLTYELYGGAYDPASSYTVSFSSSDPSVATVSNSGKITAKATGSTTVTASVEGGANIAIRTYYVTDYSSLTAAYTSDLKFRTGYQHTASNGETVLHSNSVIQSWDWTTGNTYFTQLNGGRSSIALSRCNVEGTKSAKFLLHFAGHADTICKEESGDGTTWIWISNYGTIDEEKTVRSEGRYYYKHNQTVCRIPASTYSSGTILDPWDISEHYVFQTESNYLHDIQVSYDEDNDLLALWGINPASTQGQNIKLKVFKMSEVKALNKTNVTLKPITYGGYTEPSTGIYYPEVTYSPTIQAYNLASLTPVLNIVVPVHHTYVTYPQGFEYYHNKLYYFYGSGEAGASNNTAKLVIINPKTASIIYKNDIPWVTTKSTVSEFSTTGYFEPEGVKVQDGCIYLGWAGIGSTNPADENNRTGHIFKFAL